MATASYPTAGTTNRTTLRILLVEDHEDSRELMAEILRRTGEHAIALAGSAEEGLELLRGAAFDLVVTDLGFPGRSGLEMLDQADAEGLLATTSVVVCSGTGWSTREARDRGVELLRKPVDANDVFTLVERVAVAASTRMVERASGPRLGGE
jgi:two-component system, chemotaxis family, CheB/CheR fusion protein